jgi:Ca2+-binding EF-hand superfamily protein
MTKFLLGGALAAMVVAGAAFAQGQPPAKPALQTQPGPRGRMMMQTENRADVAGHVQKMFDRLDTNHDGFIAKAEVDALQAQRTDRMEKRAERFDPSKIFDRLDANHDGKVTRAEAEAARSQRAQAKGGQPAAAQATGAGRLFDRADANKDGILTRAEFEATGAQLKSRMEKAGMHRGGLAGAMFGEADTNKDGKVSLAEVQAIALQHFDRADLNHDGKLTPQERQQMRQQFKAQHKPS